MNPDNCIHLKGIVQGENWTRWKPGAGARGQVRFRLAVSRPLAGEGYDLFVCAIEPRTAGEVSALERELVAGREVEIFAVARCVAAVPGFEEPAVVFVAEECGFDGSAVRDAHSVHKRPQMRGKLAAAGENEPELFNTGGGR